MQIPIIRARKPPFGSIPRVNYDNPISEGIIGCYLPGLMRGQPVIGGVILANGSDGSGERALTRDGIALKTGAGLGNRGLIGVAPTNFKSGSEFSIQWRGVLHGNCDPYSQLILITYNSGDDNPYFVWGITTDYAGYTMIQLGWNTLGTGQRTSAYDVSSHYGKMVDLVATFRANGNSTFYVNGVQVSQALFGVNPPTSATSQIVINQYVPGWGRSANASCNIATFWDRELTPSEVQALSTDPYCCLSYPEDELFATLKGGGAPPPKVLTAEAGSYALTGTAATLRKGKVIAAGVGSYALTGTAATLRKKVLAAGVGSYALTGTAATLRKGKVIAAGVGSYALTGTAATLRKGKVIAAGVGSYALTGTAATLIRGKVIAAGVGAYALTGTAATLTKGVPRTLVAGIGSYTLTGTAASLLRGRKLAATTAGTYALTGTAATLLRGRKLAATTAGVYALTGTAATLIRGKVIAAGVGSYALTGTAAALLRGRKLAVDVGSYTLTGTAAGLTKGIPRTLAAGVGSYTLTGTTASLLRGRKIVADEAGDYFLFGSRAVLGIGPWLLAGVGNVSQVITASHTLSVPSDSSEGDLLIAVLSARIAHAGAISLPSGGEWTLIGQQNNNNVITGTTGAPHGLMAYCVRGATAPNTTFTYPAVPSVALGNITAYRGQHPLGPLDITTFSTTPTGVGGVTVLGLTTGYNDDLIVIGACGGSAGAWTNFDATDPSVSSGTGSSDAIRSPLRGAWLRRYTNLSLTGADVSLSLADAVKTTKGATGFITATSSTSSAHVILVAAFKSRSAVAVLAAGTGTYALTGTPALLTASRRVITEPGVYALTGTAATLTVRAAQTLVAGVGSYALTGTAAALLRGRKLAATTAGAYALTGTAAALTKGVPRTLVAGTGNYALTGTAASLLRGRKLAATTAGAYALTGATDVQLRKGAAGSIIASAGSYALTGTAASLRRGRTIRVGFEEITWDPATIAGVTLSNGNLTATSTGTTSANQGAHGAAWGPP